MLLHQIQGLLIADHDGNVLPRAGAPVWIVITFLRNLISPPCSGFILPRVDWWITFKLLVSGKQTCGTKHIMVQMSYTKWNMPNADKQVLKTQGDHRKFLRLGTKETVTVLQNSRASWKKKSFMRTSLSEDYKCFNTHNSECIYPLLRLQLYKRLRI